ncbi:hypothetical protein ACPESR_04750 [Nocardia testacea]|uniref:hypothetical protein n=1 Tax=Nocardia testacea TaxID=248551 RepID=UPI003C2D9E4E
MSEVIRSADAGPADLGLRVEEEPAETADVDPSTGGNRIMSDSSDSGSDMEGHRVNRHGVLNSINWSLFGSVGSFVVVTGIRPVGQQ